ncbi:MAG: hypothetical protein ACE14V_16780 [bacterium]
MSDCQYYSEQMDATPDKKTKQVFCSSPNWAILSISYTTQSCPSYRLDWTKRAKQISASESNKSDDQPEPTEITAAIVPNKTIKPPNQKPVSVKAKKNKTEHHDSSDKQHLPKIKKPKIDFAPPVIPNQGPAPEPAKPYSRMKNLPPPEETVRQFIESWNTQDFITEYHCLSHTLPLPPLGDYIQSRKSIYQGLAEQIGKGVAPQQVAEIKKVEFRTGGAYIECLRKDILGNEKKEYLQEFLLRREEGGWKITKVIAKRHKTT